MILHARRFASAVYMLWLCVCLSARQSQAGVVPNGLTWDHRNNAARWPRNSSLVLWRRRSLRNFVGISPTGAPNAGGVDKNCVLPRDVC